MARNWDYDEKSGTLIRKYFEKTGMDESGKPVYESKAEELEMYLVDLFPEIESFDKVQLACTINGLKQKLDDAIARSKDEKLTEVEKRAVQASLWDRISIERKWNAEGKTREKNAIPLKTLVPALQAAGLSTDSIATACSTTVEKIERFLETGLE